jgi:hypothetical protein
VSSSRVLAFGGVAAAVAGVVLAVTSALGSATGGVAAADATQLTRVVHVGGADVTVTTRPSGTVCFSAARASGCAVGLSGGRLSYATAKDGRRVVLAGVAGPGVKAVIARLSRGGVVWPTLRSGAFYAVLPDGFRLRAIVKVLAGGRRVTFRA